MVHIPLSACEGKLNCHCALYKHILLYSFYSRVVLSEAVHSHVRIFFIHSETLSLNVLITEKTYTHKLATDGGKANEKGAQRLHSCTLRKLSTPPTMYESTRSNKDSMNELDERGSGGIKIHTYNIYKLRRKVNGSYVRLNMPRVKLCIKYAQYKIIA